MLHAFMTAQTAGTPNVVDDAPVPRKNQARHPGRRRMAGRYDRCLAAAPPRRPARAAAGPCATSLPTPVRLQPQGPQPPLSGLAAAGLAAILFAQALVLSAIRGGTSYDGAEQLLYTQYLDWGYGRSQPPLYTWLLWTLHQILGVSALTENLLKFALLGVGLTGMAWLAQALWPGVAHAGSAALLLCVLVPDIAWEMQRNYAHSVLLFALLPWGGWLYLQTRLHPTPVRWVALALVAALSVLAKYNALLFWAALILADGIVHGRRALFSQPMAWAAALMALVLLLPHAWWTWRHPAPTLRITDRMGLRAHDSLWHDALAGVTEWGVAWLALFVLPALLYGWAHLRTNPQLTPAQSWSAADRSMPTGAALPEWHGSASNNAQLWAWTCIMVLALSLLAVLLTGMTRVQPRWLLPTAVPLLAWMAGRIASCAPTWRALRWFALVFGMLVIVGNWWAAVKPGTRTAYDYAALSSALRDRTGADCAVFTDYAHFANLRLADPRWCLANPAMPQQPGLGGAERPVALWLTTDPRARDATLSFAQAHGWEPVGPTEALALPHRWGTEALPVTAQRLTRWPAARANRR